MVIPPKYKITPQILELVSKIDANLIYLSSINLPEDLNNKIQRVSLLKSSLYSARIEGNPLLLEQINSQDDKNNEKKEVFNLLKAAEFIRRNIKSSSSISSKILFVIHSMIMTGLPDQTENFRQEPGAIFNAAGFAVYITPAPAKIPQLIKKLLNYCNAAEEKFPLVNAFIAHLIFEKIHPFLDGNGRVGRLLIYAILKSKQKIDSLFIPFEEYLDKHKEEYYFCLDNGLDKPNDYLIFMLEAYYAQTNEVKLRMEDELKKDKTMLLTPRQEEIFYTIKDQSIVSFDFIKRRFLKVPSRTLSYDLKKLINKKLVIKIGETKGTYYKIAS
ncbi:MAG: Fic family protein [Candidatus Daviesbacteria bacterium]|nr:Fic family protein [Candidatus Daviesbacteria bacterium]